MLHLQHTKYSMVFEKRVDRFLILLETCCRCAYATSTDAVREHKVDTSESRGGHYFADLGVHGKYSADFYCKVLCFTLGHNAPLLSFVRTTLPSS